MSRVTLRQPPRFAPVTQTDRPQETGSVRVTTPLGTLTCPPGQHRLLVPMEPPATPVRPQSRRPGLPEPRS